MTLRTARLTLRAPTIDDLGPLHDVFSNPAAMRYWSTPPHPDLATTQENLSRMMAAAERQLVYFVIERDGLVIGTAGIHTENEAGFILHPDHWRRGYATEAMRAIIPHMWETTDVTYLTADVDPRNLASLQCLNGLGFRETSRAANTFCINGEWSDSIYLRLDRPSNCG